MRGDVELGDAPQQREDALPGLDTQARQRVGEAAVREAFPNATILRPSIVFGPEDGFFNKFASMAQVSPVLPLIGGHAWRTTQAWMRDSR